MSGWPSIGRAEEHRLSESLRRADADAASSLYEAYADRLSDYATTMLRDQGAAAEVVHDTIVTALARADRLKDPGRLRAWLYALARFHCLVRPRATRTASRDRLFPATPPTGETAAAEMPTAPWSAPETAAGPHLGPHGDPHGDPHVDAHGDAHGDATGSRAWRGAAAWQTNGTASGASRGLAAGGRTTTTGLTTAHVAVGVPGETAEDGGDPELESLVHQALGELGRPEREALVLTARHGLSTAEVGAVAGAASRQAASRVAQARDHLENAAAAVVLARTGRAHCPDLSAMLDSWEGPLTEPLRKRLARHVSACEVCTEGRRKRVSAERLLQMVPVAYAPLSLRRRVVDTCADPERAATRAAIAPGDEHFDREGFPIMPDRRRGGRGGRAGRVGRVDDAERRTARLPVARRRPRRLITVISTLACVGVVAGVMAAAAGLDSSAAGGRTQALVPPALDPTTGAGPDEVRDGDDDGDDNGDDNKGGPDEDLNGGPGADAPTDGPGARPSSSPTSAATSPSATRPASRPSSRPVATRGPAVARLTVTCPAALGENRTGVIRVAAVNAPIAWSATTGDGLVLTPARGRLKAGASARLAVGTDEIASGSGVIRFDWSGGTRTCRISWNGEDTPSESEPPPGEDSDSEPTDPTASRSPDGQAGDVSASDVAGG